MLESKTIDLITLRQHLLDLLCQLAYQGVTSFSLQGSSSYHQWQAGNAPPQGALAIGRIFLSACR